MNDKHKKKQCCEEKTVSKGNRKKEAAVLDRVACDGIS